MKTATGTTLISNGQLIDGTGAAAVPKAALVIEEGRITYHYVVIDFWARLASGQAAPGDDAAAIAWTTMDEVYEYALMPDSLQVVRDAYALWNADKAQH